MDLRVGAYAIVHDERGVLLSHWQDGAHGGWTLPGGGMEPGEHPEATVVREVREETGYDVRVDAILGVGSILISGADRLTGPGHDLQGLRIVYRCTIIGGELAVEQDGSTDDVGWFTLDEIARLERVELVDEGLAFVGLALPGPAIDPTWK
ncbi:MAG: NUDIX domain-containing protein [Chryseoglobus sp.]|nr:NUDIX domain-containing protein [Microcella sp.]